MTETTVATAPQQAPAATEGTHNRERYLAPPVDIYETPEGLVVVADLPGVTRDDLDIRVDNNVLTLRGISRHTAPGDAVSREYELINFFRQFELGDTVDQDKISAELKLGVLTLHLPKTAEAKPRRIDVQMG